MKKRVKISELIEILAKIEGKSITDAGLRRSLARAEIKTGKDHKVDLESALRARKKSKATDKTKVQKATGKGDFASVADARIKKISLECERLQIEIDKISEKLVERKEVEKAFSKVVQDLKHSVNNWAMRTVAIKPKLKKQIDDLKKSYLNAIEDKFDV